MSFKPLNIFSVVLFKLFQFLLIINVFENLADRPSKDKQNRYATLSENWQNCGVPLKASTLVMIFEQSPRQKNRA